MLYSLFVTLKTKPCARRPDLFFLIKFKIQPGNAWYGRLGSTKNLVDEVTVVVIFLVYHFFFHLCDCLF